jgi:hypothetical protein
MVMLEYAEVDLFGKALSLKKQGRLFLIAKVLLL